MGLWKKEMDIQNKLIKDIKSNLTQDLLKPKYRNSSKNYLWGHCYVASEAFYHLSGGSDSNYCPMYMKIDGITHWFLKDDNDNIVDITAGQFDFDLDYSQARKAAFLTKKPSKRSKILMSRIIDM